VTIDVVLNLSNKKDALTFANVPFDEIQVIVIFTLFWTFAFNMVGNILPGRSKILFEII